jgi:hypothetical protein
MRLAFDATHQLCRRDWEAGVYLITLDDGTRWRWVLVD